MSHDLSYKRFFSNALIQAKAKCPSQGHRIWNFSVKDLETWVAPATRCRGAKHNRCDVAEDAAIVDPARSYYGCANLLCQYFLKLIKFVRFPLDAHCVGKIEMNAFFFYAYFFAVFVQ